VHTVDVLLLEIVDSDLITILELIEKSKYTIILTLNPWEIRRVSENENISLLSRFCSARIADNSFFEFFHEDLV
jgi:hypothetical protein